MGKPLYEHEAKFIQSLKEATGKSFEEWLVVMGSSDVTDRKQLKTWLQENYALEYMPSHKLAFLYFEDVELNGPKIWFSTLGRGGEMTYESLESTFTMWWEQGGDNALMVIEVPNKERWEALTNTPLERRDYILNFIGRETIKKQAGGKGSFKINEGSIVIYH